MTEKGPLSLQQMISDVPCYATYYNSIKYF